MWNKSKKYLGYSAFELTLVLSVIGMVLFALMSRISLMQGFSPAERTAQQAYDYSLAVTRYITTHHSLLHQLLTNNTSGNGKIVTIPVEVLKKEGFIKDDSFDENKLKQYPCTIIYYDNHQLQSFIYYRTDDDKPYLNQNQLNDGLNHMGAMLGLYQNNIVKGSAKDWQLDQNFVKDKFIAKGNVDLANPIEGTKSSDFVCRGKLIANNSYVVNVTNMLSLNNKLPSDDTIHQYQDMLHDPKDSTSNNMMNDDLIMDYLPDGTTKHRLSNIVFQMNPDCVMDPNKEATMQDFDPSVDGNRYPKVPNNLGCRNKQLAIQANNDSNGLTMTITGFNQAGDNTSLASKKTYVGDLKALSIQPTTKISIGTSCMQSELGKIAQQAISIDPNDINNLYISQVQCMVNPLCPNGSICYMPLNNVTVNMPGVNPEAPDDRGDLAIPWKCPTGLYPDMSSIQFGPAKRPQTQPATWCDWGLNFGPEAVCKATLATNPNVCTGFVIHSKWQLGGGDLCFSHGIIDSWGGSFRVNCTNDASKITVAIIQK